MDLICARFFVLTKRLLPLSINSGNMYKENMGIGCGSVGRAVASDTRGPQFESSHRRNFIMNIFTNNCWKDENKEKEAENGPFLKNGLI